MKIKIVFPATLLLCLLFLGAFRDKTDPQTGYEHLDTLMMYDVNVGSWSNGTSTTYTVNDSAVDEATYHKYNDVWSNIDSCIPCYMKTYDINDNLVYEGVQYTDCRIGDFIEYYPDGTTKLKGHYKENHTGKWKNIDARGYCSVKDGDWYRYDSLGNLLGAAHFVNDVMTGVIK